MLFSQKHSKKNDSQDPFPVTVFERNCKHKKKNTNSNSI